MILKIQGLSASFGTRRILDGVSFNLERGRTLALMGPNGAGKTTLLRCLLSLVRFEGRVEIDGLDISKRGVAARRKIGYVPQMPAFYDMKAGEWLRFVARLRGVAASEGDFVLERVGLEAESGRDVRVFSGGMQQRLSLAAALLGNPPIILLDEPTANLDPRGRSDLLGLLRDFRAEGKTLVLSSHRAAEVRDLADHVLLLDRGRVARWGPPSDVIPPGLMEVRVEAHESDEKRRIEGVLALLHVALVSSANGTVNGAFDAGRIVPVVEGLRAHGVYEPRIRIMPMDEGAES